MSHESFDFDHGFGEETEPVELDHEDLVTPDDDEEDLEDSDVSIDDVLDAEDDDLDDEFLSRDDRGTDEW